MGGKSGKPTIGYWYDMDVLATACAEADEVLEFKFADRSAWAGSVTESSTISIYKENLFGGAEREGGVYGQVDIMLGASDQPVNEFLGSSMRIAGITGPLPAYRNSVNLFFRGIAGVDSEFEPSGVFTEEAETPPLDSANQSSFGSLKPKTPPKAFRWSAMNPYFKPFKVKLRRHFLGWRPEFSKITPTASPADIPVASYWWYCQFPFVGGVGSIYPESKIPPPVGGGGYTWAEGLAPIGWDSTGSYTTMLPGHGDVASWFIKTITVPTGITTVTFDGSAENAGFLYIDGVYVYSNNPTNFQHSSNPPFKYTTNLTPGNHTIAVFLTNETGNAGSTSDNISFMLTIRFDVGVYANGANILIESLTNSVWGLGWPMSDIDDVSFTEVAETLVDEGFGLSFKWSQKTSIEDFIMLVLRHINGVLYQDRLTGKLKLKLIRDDYTIGSLIELNPFNSKLESLSRAANGEIVNEINLTYRTADNTMSTITVHDLASIQTQGQVISQDVEMIGIRTAELAARVAQRELESRVKPIAKITITTNRIGYNLHEGGVFKLNWPDHGISAMVCRIVSVDLGSLTENSIRIEAVQDVFGLPSTSYIKPQSSAWVDPNVTPQYAPIRYVTETPYYSLARSMSDADLSYLDTTDCYIDVLATEPSPDALDFNLWTAVDGNQLVNRSTGTHAAHTSIVDAIGMVESSVLHVTNAREIAYLIESDSACVIIGDEYAKITNYDISANTITVDRGSLDTVIKSHPIGTSVMLYDSNAARDEISYLPAEVVSVKVQTRTARGLLPIGSTPSDAYTINQRQARPYPPGRVRVNGLVYPSTLDVADGLPLTWAHRNRLTQTADITSQSESSITPEVGTTYTIRIYGDGDVLLRTASAVVTESYNYTAYMEESDMGSIGGGQAIDRHWDKTILLSNMNGLNTSTTFIDISPNFAFANGNAKVTNAVTLFGNNVGNFDGTGDYLDLSYLPNYNLGSADFTIEYWFRPSAVSAAQFHFDWRDANLTKGILIYQSGGAPNKISALVGDSNTSAWEVSITGTTTLVVGTLYHVRLVKNGTNWQLYLNGATQGSATSSVLPYLNSSAIYFGAARDLSVFFNGQAADLRITLAARNTSGFTAPTARLGRRVKDVNFADNKLLLIFEDDDHDQVIVDNSDVAAPVSMFGTARISTTQFKYGNSSLRLDRSVSLSDFISIPFNSSHTGLTDITVDTWIRSSDPVSAVYKVIASRGVGPSSPREGWSLTLEPDGKLALRCFNSGVVTVFIQGSTIVSIDTWVHVAFCKSGTTWYLFLNGAVEGSTTQTGAIGAGGQDLCIGRDQFFGSTSDWYGYIDEFRIRSGAHYTSTFTPPAASLYPADPYWAQTVVLIPMSGADNSTKFENVAEITKLLTPTGGVQVSTAQSIFGGASALFDGNNDRLTGSLPVGLATNDFTVEFWFRRQGDAFVGANFYQHLFDMRTAEPSVQLSLDISGSTGGYQIGYYVNGVYRILGGVATLNVWFHLALVRVAGVTKLYLDGNQVGSSYTDGNNFTAKNFTIGGRFAAVSGDYRSFNGCIDDLRVTVAGRYPNNFTPPSLEFGKYVPAVNSQLTFELESVRDGLVSWQKHRHTVTRV